MDAAWSYRSTNISRIAEVRGARGPCRNWQLITRKPALILRTLRSMFGIMPLAHDAQTGIAYYFRSYDIFQSVAIQKVRGQSRTLH